MEGDRLRLAEPLGALSLVTDMAVGAELGTALRACILASRLAETMSVDGAERGAVFWATLLRYVGCTASAHESAVMLGGDDVDVNRRVAVTDMGRPGEAGPLLLSLAGSDHGPAGRARLMAKFAIQGQRIGGDVGRSHCEVASRLAQRFGLDPAVSAALYQVAERWDGKGVPNHLAGDDMAVATRFALVAHVAMAGDALDGPEGAAAAVRHLAGGQLDPEVSAAFTADAAGWLESGRAVEGWETFLAAEPDPPVTVPVHRVDDVALGFADAADLKSPFFHGHSRGVAKLAAAAATASGWHAGEVDRLWRAGLLHDVGRVGVPSGVWEKPGALSVGEWEQVRLHPYLTHRVLVRSAALAPLAGMACSHHERLDGSGYHAASPAAAQDEACRLLAASDLYHALTEDRPHRPAHDPAAAARVLHAEVGAGRIDADAADWVLEAAGYEGERPRPAYPAELTEREVEVLRLLSAGATRKDIARALTISASTVHTHTVHIYEKIGVSTRAAAAMFAMEHDLVRRPAKR